MMIRALKLPLDHVKCRFMAKRSFGWSQNVIWGYGIPLFNTHLQLQTKRILSIGEDLRALPEQLIGNDESVLNSSGDVVIYNDPRHLNDGFMLLSSPVHTSTSGALLGCHIYGPFQRSHPYNEYMHPPYDYWTHQAPYKQKIVNFLSANNIDVQQDAEQFYAKHMVAALTSETVHSFVERCVQQDNDDLVESGAKNLTKERKKVEDFIGLYCIGLW